jgi:hypothetical protein
MEGQLRKYLRVNQKEEGEWEDLDLDSCRMLKKTCGRRRL